MRRDSTDVLFAVWFALIAVLGLAMLGVGVWALVSLVQWVTTK